MVSGMSTVKDPVCGVNLDERTAIYKSIHEKRIYYFHSPACQAEFVKNPMKYVNQDGESKHAAHYGGYCGSPGCGKPARGIAWYMYLGLLFFLVLLVLLLR